MIQKHKSQHQTQLNNRHKILISVSQKHYKKYFEGNLKQYQQMNFSNNSEESIFEISDCNKLNGRWTNEEHELFLDGLQRYGKNWKRIQNVVKTRTGSQIRSHAQKFLIKRQYKKSISISEDASEFSVSNDLKTEFSPATSVSENSLQNSQNLSTNLMLSELKNTLNLIEESGFNPLKMFSYYFFEIVKQPQHLINNNFFGHFIELSEVKPISQYSSECQVSFDIKGKVSFKPFIHEDDNVSFQNVKVGY